MPPSVQHSQNRSSDQKYEDPQGSTSTSPKPSADAKSYGPSTMPGLSYSRATAQGGSRPMTSASNAARQGTTSRSQINGPPGLNQATSSSSTSKSTTSRQPNSGTDNPTQRQSKRNGPVANPRQVDTSPTENQTNRNGSVANPSYRQPDTTHLPTENALVKSNAAPGPRVSSS